MIFELLLQVFGLLLLLGGFFGMGVWWVRYYDDLQERRIEERMRELRIKSKMNGVFDE